MKILAIDTSCDETSVAITEEDRILSNKISSQMEIHKKYGGVVPSIAKRMHEENINFVIKEALLQAKTNLDEIDAVAVTNGPGLAIALEIGIKKAKEISKKYNKPFLAINHMEGHIYSALAKNSRGNPEIKYSFPLLAILVSGGHTETVLMSDHGKYQILGKTLDDAAGEAFDKVARMLELGYPGGPIIEELAKKGNPKIYPLPIPMTKTRSTDFSYSGLKTAVLYLIKKLEEEKRNKKERIKMICDIAASFQESALEAIILKTKIALENNYNLQIKDLIIAGGVSANKELRKKIKKEFGKDYTIHFPTEKKLFGDNAGMIGIAGYYKAKRNNFADPEKTDRDPNLSL